MTSGWPGVTKGTGVRALLPAWLAVASVCSVSVVVNASSIVDEGARRGATFARWEPWVWEGTSALSWLALAPLIFLAAMRLRPPRTGLLTAIGVHLVLTAPVSLGHVGLMMGLRKLIYWAVGDDYSPDWPLAEMLFYEYRKDAASYAMIAFAFLLIERIRRQGTDKNSGHAPRIEVRDGARTAWLAPGEIEWAQAAGNYVELFGTFGTLLHRRTLASLEADLETHGFARVHRSRLVRKDAVRTVESKPSGDFDLTLASGAVVGGSRRFRRNLPDRTA